MGSGSVLAWRRAQPTDLRPDGTARSDERIVDGLMAKRAERLKTEPMSSPDGGLLGKTERRLEALERKVRELDQRTIGSAK